MNRVGTIAKHDFENARRSYLLWAVVAIFTFFVVLVTAVPGLLDDSFTGTDVVALITAPAGIFVPITAVVASYLAIAGERESGQLNILLSLPPSRLEVVTGKFLGRSAVVLAAVLVAFGVGTLVSLPIYGDFPVFPYLVTMGLTAVLGLAFVGIAVGISAMTTTRTRAMGPAVGVVILFGTGVWSGLVQGLNFVAEAGLDVSLEQDTVTLIQNVSPSQAYNRLFNTLVYPELLGEEEQVFFQAAGALPDTSEAPLFLQDWFIFLMLVAWIVVPVALGYVRFKGADLT